MSCAKTLSIFDQVKHFTVPKLQYVSQFVLMSSEYTVRILDLPLYRIACRKGFGLSPLSLMLCRFQHQSSAHAFVLQNLTCPLVPKISKNNFMYKKRISQYKTSLPSKSPPELIQNAPPQSPPPRPLPFSSFPPARPPTFSLQPRPQTLNALSPPTPPHPHNPPRTPPPRPPSRPHLCPPRHAHRPSNNGAYHTSR